MSENEYEFLVAQKARIEKEKIESLKEWLKSWGDGANWSDDSGLTVPIAKKTLLELFSYIERLERKIK